ncbi:hypothetical protein FJY94_04245 [Candidatus Kaiserbacteria bacterium]|nr:hypothetical protein [Candidatus Kaiserbacteria bacterium]
MTAKSLHATIPGMCAHLSAIYQRANALTTPRHERFEFLFLACGDIQRRYRKQQAHFYGVAIAQAFAWFISLGEDLFRTDCGHLLALAMAEKYPHAGCGYCHHSPCVCDAIERDDFAGTEARDNTQQEWSLRRWQEHLSELYGEANAKKGVNVALNRLFEEVSEVGLVLQHADGFNESLPRIEEKAALEMTDVLAWIFGVASLLAVDVETEVMRLYRSGCPVCKLMPCGCSHFAAKPKSKGLTHRFMTADEIAG